MVETVVSVNSILSGRPGTTNFSEFEATSSRIFESNIIYDNKIDKQHGP